MLWNEDGEGISALVQAQPLLVLDIHLSASLLTSPLSKHSYSLVMWIISTEHFTCRKGDRLTGHSWHVSLPSCILQQNLFMLPNFRNFYRTRTLSKQYMFHCFSFLVSYIHVWISWQKHNFESVLLLNQEIIKWLEIFMYYWKSVRNFDCLFFLHIEIDNLTVKFAIQYFLF